LSEGLSIRGLSPADVVELEPALAPIAAQLTGAIHYETDESGDAYRFCVALADHAHQRGVEFRFRTEVTALEMRAGRVTAVISERERFVADQYIVAAGSHSAALLRRVGVQLPIQPVKGYSITLDNRQWRPTLGIPVIDDDWHAAVVQLDSAIRVAGTAEFAGYDLTLQPARIANLVALLKQVLPQAQVDPETLRPWCGLRPLSADGVPIIGSTPIPNLFVNAGHGHLGWTMAAGSGQLLAHLMSDNSPPIDSAPYSFARFSAGGGAR
jgi:D-amino-acid dehydrogenase